jgi:hypothetical protein
MSYDLFGTHGRKRIARGGIDGEILHNLQYIANKNRQKAAPAPPLPCPRSPAPLSQRNPAQSIPLSRNTAKLARVPRYGRLKMVFAAPVRSSRRCAVLMHIGVTIIPRAEVQFQIALGVQDALGTVTCTLE